MLENKYAIIYGVGESLGGAVAREMAAAGAMVFLTNRHLEKAQQVAREIQAQGGRAEAAQVDALDKEQIERHLEEIVKKTGRVDISFNLAGIDVKQDVPLVQMKMEEFVKPVTTAMQTHFLTATAAARVMVKQRSGVILTLTATPGGIGYEKVGGFGPVCAAIENFSVNLAIELGEYSVRVVNIRSGGSPDSRPFLEGMIASPAEMPAVLNKLKSDTILNELPSMKDIAAMAVFLASDKARMMTGTTVDLTVGTTGSVKARK